MTTARAETGFTLFELLVVFSFLIVVSGLVMTTLVSAHKRFRRATGAIEARAEIARAAERMRRDVHSARSAAAEDGALVLVRPDGARVEWHLVKGRLVRTRPDGEVAYRARLAGFRANVEKKAGRSPFVEVGIVLEGRRRRARGKRPAPAGPVLYVGASLRAGGAKQ